VPGRVRGLQPPAGRPHAEGMDISGKLQLKPGQSVAVLNPPPDLVLPGVMTAATVAARLCINMRPYPAAVGL
jgi:hypothetical protein